MNTEPPTQITVKCDQCGKDHEGNYAGQSQFNKDTPIYEVTCTVDWLSDWYTLDAAIAVIKN